MGSHSVTFHLTQVNTPRRNPRHDRLELRGYRLDLRTPEGWKAELTYSDWLHTETVYPTTVYRITKTAAHAGSRTHNLLITSPTPYPLHHQATKLRNINNNINNNK